MYAAIPVNIRCVSESWS